MTLRASFIVLAIAAMAGCASRTPATTGKHLVYRDAGGAPTLQIDYPSDATCRKVEAIASRNAHCEPRPADSGLQARATLRYDPPGMLVQGHYPDVERCRSATSAMAKGVEVVHPCTEKSR